MTRDTRQTPACWGVNFPGRPLDDLARNVVACNDNWANGGRTPCVAWSESWLSQAHGATGAWERRRVNASSLIRHASNRLMPFSAC